ncbi:MAG: hypothetical protein IPL79_14170 [Myxococcales bacterium]|nr:hypothetical protein [Myxococcales bacterium]
MSKHTGPSGWVGRMALAVLALGLCHCAEAKFEVIAAPDAPPPPNPPTDAPPEDAPVVPDAPSLDAPIDALPDSGSSDAGADASTDGPVDGGTDGPVDAPVDAPPPPPGDVCATAFDITAQAKLAGGYAAQATTLGFNSDEYNSCGFGSYAGLDRVYRFDLAVGDILTVLAAPTGGSGVDMALSLNNGCGSADICANAADSGFTDDQEVMVWIADATSTFYLYVDAYYINTGGTFSLNVIISTPPPPTP